MIAKGGSRNGLPIHSEDVIIKLAVPEGFHGYTVDTIETYHKVDDSYILRHVEQYPRPPANEETDEQRPTLSAAS